MKKKLSLFLILILILGAIYFGLGYYFSIYTFPNTYFGHQDVSLVKISSLPKYAESRELTIKGRDDHEEIINLKASGLMERADHLYDYQQNPWAWPLEILKEHEIQEEMTRKIDGERLQASLDQLEIMKNPINPQNAHIERKEDGFIISPEREGNLIHKERLYSAIVQAFTKGEYELNLDSEYEEPEIRKEDLEDSLKQLNKIAKANIKLLLPDGTEDQLKPLDYMDENNAVNGDMVQKYVEELKAKYDNIGATRSFTTSGGDRIDISGGIFGVKLNRDKTTAQLVEAMNQGEDQSLEPIYTRKALNGGQIGDTYIEISINSQHLWFYKNGVLIQDTPIVTGNINQGYYTPKGVWEVWIKERDRRLRGKNRDGSEYDVPVNYWMQVDYTGIGLHDTYYRSSYGRQIYKYDGSHGCINMPYQAVKNVFNQCEYGTPVVIY